MRVGGDCFPHQVAIAVFFLYEMVAQVLARGLFLGPGNSAYLRDGGRILDFCLVPLGFLALRHALRTLQMRNLRLTRARALS